MAQKIGDNWYTNIRWRIGPHYGRYRRKIGKKKDAQEAEARIKVGIADGTWLPPELREIEEPPPVVLFVDFIRDQFLPWSGMEHSPGHHKEQQRICGKHLVPYFEAKALDAITRAEIEQYMILRRSDTYTHKGWKKAKPVQAATVNREIACLKAIFRKAMEWEVLVVSPIAQVKALQEAPNTSRLLIEREIQALIDATPEHLRALVGVAVYAGLRRAELFSLEWRDVDLKNGMITVAPRGQVKRTKNQRVRRIPIAPDLDPLLRAHPHRVGRLVFPNRQGHTYYKLDRQLCTAAKVAGIEEEKVGLHQLRHCFASHCMMCGIDPKTVQGWMGHRDLKTTMRYLHTSPEHEQASIEKLRFSDHSAAKEGPNRRVEQRG